jgi:hydroxypyruvate isomerase
MRPTLKVLANAPNDDHAATSMAKAIKSEAQSATKNEVAAVRRAAAAVRIAIGRDHQNHACLAR